MVMDRGVLRLRVQGEPGAVSVRAFVSAVRDTFRVLADIDVAISRSPEKTLDWLVTDLSTGSLVLVAQARVRRERQDIGREVASAFVAGMRRIEQEGASPPYLSVGGMRTAQRLLRLIGRDGATGLEVSDLIETARLTKAAATTIAQLIPERQHSLGSVEGRLETISVHQRPGFTIYLSRTRKAVTCRIADVELFQAAMEALGRRVLVAGTVHANARGEPVSVDAKRLRVFRAADELPKASDLYGVDPEFTGGASSDEYVRSLRGA